ncbi:MAG: hypothetical protein U9Q07_01910 [Planctomycetota bacterium]|nr:hypothetical protein [Planctomycetota bacterium]
MKKTGLKAAIVLVVTVIVLAGLAIAGPGGGGRRGGGPGPEYDNWARRGPGVEGPMGYRGQVCLESTIGRS